MTLLSLLTRPLSVSCLLLFGVVPACISPSLWAASRGGTKALSEKETKQENLARETEEWGLFHQISEQFRGSDPEDSLKKACVFLLRWPRSPMADSVRLMAASCASRLERYEQALSLCNDLQDTSLKNQTLAQRLQWLYALGRYQEAYEIGLHAPVDSLSAERRAWSRYYMAQSLYQEAQNNHDKTQFFSEKDLTRLEQAYSLYTSSQEIIGYMAVYGRATSAETIGLTQVAANSYLKAADLPGAEAEKCRYLAARLFSDDEPEKAFSLCEGLAASSGPWRAPAAFLWMKVALKTQRPQEILKRPEWVKAAAEEDSLGASYFLASAQADAGQKELAIETFKKLVPDCLVASTQDVEAYAKPAMVRLADLFTAANDPKSLVELNDSVGQKGGRSQEYFYVCFKVGQLFDALQNKEAALDQYARIVVQAPQSPWIGQALLRKGLLEAEKGYAGASWSSLDLYLRRHATDEGIKLAWPTFLKISSALQDNAASSSFNKQRFQLVLNRLKEFKCPDSEKIQYLSDETERLFEESPAKSELWLLAMASYCPQYFTPEQELLMAMCRARAEGNVDSFVAHVKPAIARETKDPAKLEIRYAKCLLTMAKDRPESSAKAYEMAANAFYSAFEKAPMQLSKEDIVWTARWVQSLLNEHPLEGVWGNYFIDPIYDRAKAAYMAVPLDENQNQWAERAGRMLQGVLSRGQADSATRLMLARLQWAHGNFKECSQTLVTLQGAMDAQQTDFQGLVRPYLTYDCGAHLLSGEINEALSVAGQLMPLMEKESDSSLLASIRLTLARACSQAAIADAKQSASLYKKALGFYELVIAAAQGNSEPIYLEAGVEKALLLGHYLPEGSKEELSSATGRHLLELKRHYVEADTAYTKDLHSFMQTDPKAKNLWQSYMLLLDALLAQQQAQTLLQQSAGDTDKADAKMHLNLAQNLYQTLLTEKYGLTPFLKEMSTKGIAEVKGMEQK